MTELTEGKRLKWLGLRREGDDQSEINAEISRLKDTVGEFDAYQSFVGNSSSISNHESRLINNHNWPSPDAELFSSKIENSFDGWSAYDNYINVQVSSYQTMKGDFPSEITFGGIETTSDGEIAVGVRLHEEQGVSKKGLTVEAGTIELFGTRFEVSQMEQPSADQRDLAYGPVQADPMSPDVDEEFDVFCDITNNSNADVRIFPQLAVNGVVEEQQQLDIPQGETREARFSYTQPQFARLDVQIDNEEPIEVRVASGDLT